MGSSDGSVNAHAQFARYVIIGLVATGVHYAVLTFNLTVLQIRHAAVANFFAAVAGIGVSFVGNRYVVFRALDKPWWRQFARFWVLYACIALLHSSVLWIWTDLQGLDYRFGFVIATCLQIGLSFIGNKRLVFQQ